MRFWAKRERPGAGTSAPKALTFDVFGTTVDWLGGMTDHVQSLFERRSISGDAKGLVQEWRSHYKPAIKAVRDGKRPWTDFDQLHREELDKIVSKFGMSRLTKQDRDELTRAWRYLKAWPDVIPALHRLRKLFLVAPLSNGTTRQLVETARYAGLPWDAVLGGDIFRTYKPDGRVYLGAAELFAVKPHEVLMVAAHNEDLAGAKMHGLRTCFVHRATEDQKVEGEYDYVVEDFEELARVLGAV